MKKEIKETIKSVEDLKKEYTSIIPFGIDEVIETRYRNGEMFQITRPKTKEDEEYLKLPLKD